MEARRGDCVDLDRHVHRAVDNDSEVSCLCAGGGSGSEVCRPPGGVPWRGIFFKYHHFGLVRVKFEVVGLHPGGHYGHA